jgi:hypothetical protein
MLEYIVGSDSICIASMLVEMGDPPALSRNRIDGDEVESEFSCLSVKPS